MSTTAHSPYHRKPGFRPEKRAARSELKNKAVAAFTVVALTAGVIAVVKGKLKVPDFLNRPPVAEDQSEGNVPPVITGDGSEGQKGGRGGSAGFPGSLCPWETPAVKNAAKAVLGTEVSCGPPVPGITGAVWSNDRRTASVTTVVEPLANAVPPSALRDPKKAFSQHWESFNAGTGPDTFCNMHESKLVTYQDGLVITTTLHDTLGQLPVGCTPQLGAFVGAFVQSGMANRA